MYVVLWVVEVVLLGGDVGLVVNVGLKVVNI